MSEIRNIKIEYISPDPRNPRKKFSEEAIKELADNIAQQGLLQPITLRPTEWWDEVSEEGEIISVPCRYQVVCGERRFRAYKKLHNEENLKTSKYSSIPAIVREMDDNEAFDAMITENMLRKDVNPAEEGRAFIELRKRMDIKEIANRFGKSEQFVRQRLQLSSLIPHLVKMIEDEKLPVSYALSLSRFTPEMQRTIYDDILQDANKFPTSLKGLNNIIDLRYMMYFKKAMFDPKVGDNPCHLCTCNTANQGLFDEYKGEEARCTNRECFKKKQEQAVIGIAKEMHKDGYLIVLPDNDMTSTVREKLDAIGIGYSCNYYRFKASGDISDREVKAVLLCGYQGFTKEIGCMYMDVAKEVRKNKSNADKILELKMEDDNNLRIRDENTVKDLRTMFTEADYYKIKGTYFEPHAYAIMIMDLPKYMQEYLGVGDDIFQFCSTITVGQKDMVERCWVQHRLDTINVAYNRTLKYCLHSLSAKHYPDQYKEICNKYEAVYQQRKERLEHRYNDLDISLEDITSDMIAEYEAMSGKGEDKDYRKGKKEYLKIVSRVTKDNANRLADIQRKYGFKSNYEISQYLMHCFLRVADPDNDPIMEPVPEEIVDMFGDLSDYGAMKFEKPKRRIPSNKEDIK